MRKFHGLKKLCENHQSLLTKNQLAQLLIEDLQKSQMRIYGKDTEDKPILLAVLPLQFESLQYSSFEQRLDLVFIGEIVADSSLALTYCLQGLEFSVTGRCSTIPKVCGVDLYLSRSFSGKIGDTVRQPFAISLKDLI